MRKRKHTRFKKMYRFQNLEYVGTKPETKSDEIIHYEYNSKYIFFMGGIQSTTCIKFDLRNQKWIKMPNLNI